MSRSRLLWGVVSILIVVLVVALAGCPLFPGGDDTDDTGDEEQEEQDDGTDDDAEPSDGTVTVSLSGATAANGEYLVAYAYDAGETTIGDPSRVRGVDYVEISGGSASVVLKESDGAWMPTLTDWTATAGESYDVYAYTTSDDTNLAYASGSRVAADYPIVATIDGDQTVSLAYGDMAVNFFAADLYSATDHAGEDFVVGVFPRGRTLIGVPIQCWPWQPVRSHPTVGPTWSSRTSTAASGKVPPAKSTTSTCSLTSTLTRGRVPGIGTINHHAGSSRSLSVHPERE